MNGKKIAIINGLLINPLESSPQKKNLYIADGNIIAYDKPPAEFKADVTIDAKDAWICPGLIDLTANLGDEKQEIKAALQRGITTHPKLGALTHDGLHLAPMATEKQLGAVAVSNGKQPITDTRVLYNAFAYAASFSLPVIYFAQDCYLAQGGCVHDGVMSTRLGLPGIPVSAEIIAVNTSIELQRATGVQLHLSRLTCAESIEILCQAQKRGQTITADVAIHHLYLTEMDIDSFNPMCHTNPPLRSFTDQAALLEGIKNGVISAICSDHEPCGTTAKLQPFPSSTLGISGLDTFFSLLLGLREKLPLSPNQLISLATSNPAKILNLPQGTLNLNSPADICIIKPDTTWTLTPQNMQSRGKNTPFLNWPLHGVIQATIKNGDVVYHI